MGEKRFYWTSTLVVSALMLFSGSADLLRFQPFVEDIRRLGYPDYVLTILGVAKLLGVTILISPAPPPLKEWAYAGFAFALGGALISQLVAGSAFVQVLPALVCGSALAVAYLAYRSRDSSRESA